MTDFIAPGEIVSRMNAVLRDDEAEVFAPSAEQEPVVTAAWDEPALVVAGAGSGKTETMAHRVLWLIANGEVTGIKPEQVLGLTFTRKAAGELDERFRVRLSLLERAGLLSREGADETPKVSTYNSFANELFRDYALLIGRDPNAQVLTEASSRMLAREVVTASLDTRLADIGSASTVVTQMLKLARAMGDNLVEPEHLREFAQTVPERLALILAGDTGSKVPARRSLESRMEALQHLDPLLDLVEAYERLKLERGLVEFSDQVRLAITAIEEVPQVRDDVRERFPIVLLDEYQDTSVMQVRLLAAIFGSHPVMAVGDPNQSIYGWRGAAAGTLERFLADFGGTSRFSLPTSWRNDRRILQVANRIANALQVSGDVAELTPRPGAGDGEVKVGFYEESVDEARALADWLAERVTEDGTARTAAVLFRAKKRMRLFANALEDRGVDFVIVGGEGLLSDPAVVDVTSMLKAAARSDEGGALVRVLSSSRWRIGPSDLQALVDYSRMLGARESGDAREAMRESSGHDDIASTIDALDSLLDHDRNLPGHSISAEGLARMVRVARELRFIRSNRHLPALELVRLTIRTMGIEQELVANEHRDTAILDQFLDQVASLQSSMPKLTLDGLIEWILVAEDDDSITTPPPEPKPGVVQLITMHASKGLEWELVAIPLLRTQTFPSRPKDLSGWLASGTLPFEFRGDSESLPKFDLYEVATADDFEESFKAFKAANRQQHASEERRVAYVAFTRAKRALWLSGGELVPNTSTAEKPSEFLTEAAEALGVPLDRIPASGAASRDDQVVWPPEPFGSRAERVEAAAELVDSATALEEGELFDHIQALLAATEHERAETRIPERLNASAFHEWVTDPVATRNARRRPLPVKPWPQARLGTLFHSMAESLLAAPGLGDAIDFDQDPFAEEDLPGLDVEQLQSLKESFLRSKYTSGALEALHTELEVHLRLGASTVVCKIDAVFRDGDRILVVDWKTGRRPTGPEQLRLRGLQLALYRIAYAEHAGIDPNIVDVEFYYVADDKTVALAEPLTKQQLIEQLDAAAAKLQS